MAEKSLPHVVTDTNVLVSALIGKSLRQLLEHLKENKFIPDLFFLNPYRNIPIITPMEFFKQMEKQIT